MEKLKLRILFAVLIVVLLSAMARSQSCAKEKVEIICDKIDTYHTVIGHLPTCITRKSMNVSTSDASVTSIVDSNKSEIANTDKVGRLLVIDAFVKFIPAGIKEKFTNIKFLEIQYSGLLSLSKENLKQFGGSLEVLDLWGNKISYIDADLFQYNTNLKSLTLTNNPIRFFGPGFFENLKNMNSVFYVNLAVAGCINLLFNPAKFTWDDEGCDDVTAETETTNLINEAKSKCSQENTSRLTTDDPNV